MATPPTQRARLTGEAGVLGRLDLVARDIIRLTLGPSRATVIRLLFS